MQKLTQQIVMTDDEKEGETVATATTDDVNDDGDSSAKRRLRNRRLNLNKLSRDDEFSDVLDNLASIEFDYAYRATHH